MDDAEVKAMLDGATPGPWRADGEPWNRVVWSSAENRVCFMAHSSGLNDERDIATSNLAAAAPELARALLAARADAKAAVAIVVEKAAEILDGYETIDDESAARGVRWQVDLPAQIASAIRALAPEDAIAEVERLRAERDAALSRRNESERVLVGMTLELEALTAEVARLRDRERVLVEALINRDGGSHDEDCKARRYANSDGLCNCGHDEVAAALAQPSATVIAVSAPSSKDDHIAALAQPSTEGQE